MIQEATPTYSVVFYLEINGIGIVQCTHMLHKYKLKTRMMFEFLSLENKVFHKTDMSYILDRSSSLNYLGSYVYAYSFVNNERSTHMLQHCCKYSLHLLREYMLSLKLYIHSLVRYSGVKGKQNEPF